MQHPSEIEYRNRSENEFGKVSVIKMSKKLVAYFSASGVTKSAAEKLAEGRTGGSLRNTSGSSLHRDRSELAGWQFKKFKRDEG